jgi:hypothetical protein
MMKIATARAGQMQHLAVFDILKDAIEHRHSVRLIAGDIWRDVSPLALGYKGEKIKCLAYQFHGGSSSGIAPEGGWRCFALDETSWAKPIDDPWQTGHNAVAKLEASLDTVICGTGAKMRTYNQLRR